MAKFLFQPTHGMSRTSIYWVWQNMKARCNNRNNGEYHRYGGRGITVCKEWNDSFSEFQKWAITAGYQTGLTLDRIDNDKGYFPENCRLATWEQQSRNKSRNHMLTYDGRTQCATDWANELGISLRSLNKRIKTGKTLDEIFHKGRLEKKHGRETDERI